MLCECVEGKAYLCKSVYALSYVSTRGLDRTQEQRQYLSLGLARLLGWSMQLCLHALVVVRSRGAWRFRDRTGQHRTRLGGSVDTACSWNAHRSVPVPSRYGTLGRAGVTAPGEAGMTAITHSGIVCTLPDAKT